MQVIDAFTYLLYSIKDWTHRDYCFNPLSILSSHSSESQLDRSSKVLSDPDVVLHRLISPSSSSDFCRPRCTIGLTRAYRAPRPPGAASLSAWGRRCCCFSNEPPQRLVMLPNSTDEADDRPTAPGAVVEAGKRDRRPPHSVTQPGRRLSLPWHWRRLFPESAVGATWAPAGKVPLDMVPTSSVGCAVPTPCFRRLLRRNLTG